MKFKIFFLSLISIFISCEEDTQVNRVRGTLLNDCTNPLGSVEIALKANVGASFSDPLILASTFTGTDGVFDFTYELEEEDQGTADLILIREKGFETLLEGLSLNMDHQLILRLNNLSQVIINIFVDRTLTPTDTLFYAFENEDEIFTEIMPTNALVLDSVFTKVANLDGTAAVFTRIYYGLGTSELQLSKEALSIQDSIFQHAFVNLSGCGDRDTTFFLIN